MLRQVAVALISSILAVACATAPSPRADADEFNHSSYISVQLADVPAYMEIDPPANYWLDASHAKYMTVVTYTGAIRPIDPNVKHLITLWAKAMQHPNSVPASFDQEVQVSQGGQTYWMPIQEVLVAPWREEMHRGTEAEVYLLLMGAYETVPVFTIASFTAKV